MSELEQLIATLNEHPDKLHGDDTPSVMRLIAIGREALGPALALMSSPQSDTRMRAQRVLEGVTMASHGFHRGHGWSRAGGEAEWKQLWASLGDLDWQAPNAVRAESVARWRTWLAHSAAP